MWGRRPQQRCFWLDTVDPEDFGCDDQSSVLTKHAVNLQGNKVNERVKSQGATSDPGKVKGK